MLYDAYFSLFGVHIYDCIMYYHMKVNGKYVSIFIYKIFTSLLLFTEIVLLPVKKIYA